MLCSGWHNDWALSRTGVFFYLTILFFEYEESFDLAFLSTFPKPPRTLCNTEKEDWSRDIKRKEPSITLGSLSKKIDD